MHHRMNGRVTLTPQIIGNVGLYYCCYRLSLLGWNVMPTARNARGVDIIAYNSKATRFISVQVKALSKHNPVPLGASLEKVMGDFWVILTNAVAEPPATYVLKPDEVRNGATQCQKTTHVSYWLQPHAYNCDEFRDAWERIGSGLD